MALLCILLLFLTLAVAGSGLKVNVYPLKARERSGSDVLLNCTFSTDDSHINLEMLTVKWISNGSNIAAQYPPGEEDASQRVKIVKDELHNGKAFLLLSNVTKTDAGSYKCEVEYNKVKADQQMNLEIQEKELQVYVASSIVQVNKRSRAVLNCTFTTGEHIDLDHLYVQWLLNEREVLSFSRIERPTRKGARLSAVGKGDVSLILPDVKNDEKGKYMCRVWYTPDIKEEFIDLEVTDGEESTHEGQEPMSESSRMETSALLKSQDYALLASLSVIVIVIIFVSVYSRIR
ncbi:uncharacterized protein LOC122813992 isoform X2 [Protopterus annectens]|uniref:uncharacterized protein LOC122813992 isoform X2 n=1 Tax=Protopterus annectens TaxID=7888 RepID=UPI001CFBC1DF|nr:uncharacterized protein LOC122813992 isoform X2 [Protopterus annectens]